MRLTTAALMLVVSTPVMAQGLSFPVSIPRECFKLAKREHVPFVIMDMDQAIQIKARFDSLNSRDPLVSRCNRGVRRAQEALAQ